MASKIILKKSSVAAKAPVAGDLEFGELAINYTDSKLYFKKADGSIDAFTSAAASAPVTSVGGNIGAVTDAQLLASIKNVDGAGSGLDADFLDGLNASAFYLASNPNGYTSNTGTVTSVGATAPLVSSGGTAPSISIPAANSTTNGYMSSVYAAKLDGIAAGATNVTNTNQLTNGAGYTTNTGTVTSVSGTGSVSGLSLSGTVTTSGSLTLSGTLSASIDNITDEARLFNNMGQNHSTQTDFNAISDFGARFVQGGTNGPTGVGTNQFYGFTLGLGNDYGLASYASQLYWPRAAQNTDTYIYVRDREGGTWGSWRKTKAGYADSAGSASSISSTTSTGIQSSFVTTINTTTPGLTTYGLAFSGSSAADNAQGITWGWSGTGAQAGIYVQSSGAYGTKMYLATTDSFAAGAKTAITIDHNGHVSLNRGTFSNGSVWINNGTNSNGYNENIRLFNAPNGVSVIAFSASGISGTPTTSILGYSDRMERRFSDGWQDRMYNGYVEAAGSYRAPIFYDSQNTAYFTDPAGRSRQSQIDFGDGGYYIHGGSWGMRNTTPYGYIEFGPANSGHAHIYTDRSNFYFNAQVQVLGGSQINQSDIRANIFYDQQDTGYYIDPNSTSRQYQVNFNNLYYAPDTSYGFIGSSIYVDTINSGYASDQLEINYVRGTWAGISHDSLRAPLYYDYNDTAYYTDQNSTSSYYRINVNNNILFTNYGRGMIGTYASTVYQAVFAMGDSYKLPDNGSTTGNLYGLAWSHPNAGGTAGNLNTHGLLVLENGGFLAAVSGSIRSRDDMRSPIFYDSNDTGYYVNPNSGSNLNDITSNQCYVNGWFRNNAANAGLYSQATTQHWSSGINGYWDASSTTTVCGIRFYTGGHLSALRGYVYADTSNNIGFLNSGGNWRLRVVGDDYTLADGSSMRAQMYYDSNNTGYYADLNSTTYLYYLQSATTVRADSDRRLKENITPITSALSLVRQLQGCRYTRNDLADKTKVYIGMIAQDVLPIVPEVVSGSEAGKYSLGYAELVPVLNEAVKELDEIVSKQAEMFEERLSKQAAIIAKLEERLSKLLDD